MADNSDKLLAMCKQTYKDPAVAELVHADAVAHGTVDMILDGRSVLPHPDDATRHYLRITGQEPTTKREAEQASAIRDLESRIAELETKIAPPPAKKEEK